MTNNNQTNETEGLPDDAGLERDYNIACNFFKTARNTGAINRNEMFEANNLLNKAFGGLHSQITDGRPTALSHPCPDCSGNGWIEQTNDPNDDYSCISCGGNGIDQTVYEDDHGHEEPLDTPCIQDTRPDLFDGCGRRGSDY